MDTLRCKLLDSATTVDTLELAKLSANEPSMSTAALSTITNTALQHGRGSLRGPTLRSPTRRYYFDAQTLKSWTAEPSTTMDNLRCKLLDGATTVDTFELAKLSEKDPSMSTAALSTITNTALRHGRGRSAVQRFGRQPSDTILMRKR